MRLRDQVPEVPSGHLDLTRIGASDAPAILGFDRYRSAHDVYLRLTEGLLEDEFPERLREAAAWGHRLEPLAAVALCESLGLDVDDLVKGESRVMEAWEWARVSPDYLLTGDAPALIECKLISARRFDSEEWGEDGSDCVPGRIKAQVYFQLAAVHAEPDFWATQGLNVDRIEGAHVAVCVGGQRLRRYWLPWDEGIVGYVPSVCESFWFENVMEKIPPTPDGSDACAKALALLASPGAPGRAATDPERDLMNQILEAKESLNQTKRRIVELENELKASMGSQSGVLMAGDAKASWIERKGSTAWRAVANVLAEKTGSDELLEELSADLVGTPSRYLKITRRASSGKREP